MAKLIGCGECVINDVYGYNCEGQRVWIGVNVCVRADESAEWLVYAGCIGDPVLFRNHRDCAQFVEDINRRGRINPVYWQPVAQVVPVGWECIDAD